MNIFQSDSKNITLPSRPEIKKRSRDDSVIALIGNPNVGKSTVFNALTGLNQHTGNWSGKTVSIAQGNCITKQHSCIFVDLPGTYSLLAHSAEEEVARNFICFDSPDSIIVVCDATCLERNLNLVLQVLEISSYVVVCINLADEAKRKNIRIDLQSLSARLGVPVVSTSARKKKGLSELLNTLDDCLGNPNSSLSFRVRYPDAIENAVAIVEAALHNQNLKNLNSRWLSLRLLEQDSSLTKEIDSFLGTGFSEQHNIQEAVSLATEMLTKEGISADLLKDQIVSSLISEAESICQNTVTRNGSSYTTTDRKIDRILTSRWAGYPVMLTLLAFIFWITIAGANYPTTLLSSAFLRVEESLSGLFSYFNSPDWLHGIFVQGIYRVTTWVIAVMLPPMAIFFPLFTLLEDAGYLPRAAYNLDKPFKCCRACGKQALTMCMVCVYLYNNVALDEILKVVEGLQKLID